jgi:hypothetical protein
MHNVVISYGVVLRMPRRAAVKFTASQDVLYVPQWRGYHISKQYHTYWRLSVGNMLWTGRGICYIPKERLRDVRCVADLGCVLWLSPESWRPLYLVYWRWRTAISQEGSIWVLTGLCATGSQRIWWGGRQWSMYCYLVHFNVLRVPHSQESLFLLPALDVSETAFVGRGFDNRRGSWRHCHNQPQPKSTCQKDLMLCVIVHLTRDDSLWLEDRLWLATLLSLVCTLFDPMVSLINGWLGRGPTCLLMINTQRLWCHSVRCW